MSNNAVTKTGEFLPPEIEEVKTDFDYTRKNLYQLIEQSMRGIEEMAPLAEQAQSARVYEVFFNAIKTTAELNEKLADHSVKKQEQSGVDNKSSTGDTINQNLFVGSATELLEIAENFKKNKKKKDDGSDST
jgi:hypothetical protein